MLSLTDLQSLSKKIEGAFFDKNIGRLFWGYYELEETGSYQFAISVYQTEFPAECFDLLSRMEATGIKWELRSYPYDAEWPESGYSIGYYAGDNSWRFLDGKTRTAAIVRLFLVCMPDIEVMP